MQAIGIDVGGSGCRLAVVNTATGEVEGAVVRLEHDLQTSAQDVLVALRAALDGFPSLPVGLGFPGRVDGSTVRTAPNLRSTWPGTDVAEALDRSPTSRCSTMRTRRPWPSSASGLPLVKSERCS